MDSKNRNTNPNSELELNDFEERYLDMECLHDSISGYYDTKSNDTRSHYTEDSLSALRMKANGLKEEGKDRLAASFLFLSATSFCDIESFEHCINLLYNHENSDWKRIEKLLMTHQM